MAVVGGGGVEGVGEDDLLGQPAHLCVGELAGGGAEGGTVCGEEGGMEERGGKEACQVVGEVGVDVAVQQTAAQDHVGRGQVLQARVARGRVAGG